MPFRERLKSRYGYEERVFTSEDGGFEMYGNKGTDGLLYADRTPLPNYFELRHNYAQAAVTDSILTADGQSLLLHIRNRFDFLNLKDNVTFHWVYTEDRDTLASGIFSPECQPHSTVPYVLALPSQPDDARVCLLQLEISDTQGRVFNRQTIPVNLIDLASRLLAGLTTQTGTPMTMVQEGPLVRAGRKATMAERLKVGTQRLERYLLHPSADGSLAGSIKTHFETMSEGAATHVSFTLTPDTTSTFLSELGVAYLLDPQIDRVQWIGNGPYATYPGRYRAGRYGFWTMQQGDLYFEGNRQGVDAAWLSDAAGNGVLIICRRGNLCFEQTDRGLVLTCNAAVAGQGPKFARTAFPVIAREVGTVRGDFYLYPTVADHLPSLLQVLFCRPQDIAAPLHPYQSQYDTYLLRFADIVGP
jgi:beta-galactosidase